MADARRSLPSVDALLRSEPGKRAAKSLGRPLLKRCLAVTLDEVRAAAAQGAEPPNADDILARACQRASRIASGLTPVINATGVILHTNLGRAPLPEEAARAAARAASSYADLEVDRATGKRGRRGGRGEELLIALTGAEDALVVNNCAAALLLALAALAKRKEVLVSRGELIEIGGEFRIPDIMGASGAKLVEVGTTNRTRIGDYRAAVSDRTGAILKVHPSNYRVVGFTAEASAKDLAVLAAKRDVPFIYDVGSGLLTHGHGMPPDEPSVADALADGAALVLASGDKLLGGPQAGIVMGRADLVATAPPPPDRARGPGRQDAGGRPRTGPLDVRHRPRRRHPGPPDAPRDGRLGAPPGAGALRGDRRRPRARPRPQVRLGGRRRVHAGREPPLLRDPRHGCPTPPGFAARLRVGTPSVFCRVEDGAVLLDLRTVTPAEESDLARALLYALEGDELDED